MSFQLANALRRLARHQRDVGREHDGFARAEMADELWAAAYECGCCSTAVKDRAELPDKCPIHESRRRQLSKFRRMP